MWSAMLQVTAPIQIGNKNYKMTWYVVKVPIPLLWGKESMKKAKVLLDLPNDRICVDGEWVDLIIAQCGHYGLKLLPQSRQMERFEALVARGQEEGELSREGEIEQEQEEVERKMRSQKKLGKNRGMLLDDSHKLFLKLRHIH